MLGFNRTNHRPIAEHEAEGEVDRVYHEIRQTLRVTGVNLAFKMWAVHERFLPVFWNAVSGNVETVAFERCADALREETATLADSIGKLDVADRVRLGESQAHQLKASLDLYNYVNPKILLLTSAVRLVLDGEPIGAARRERNGGLDRIELGAPPAMPSMEMVSDDPDDRRLRAIFEEIKKTMSVQYVNSDFRTLALWPDYLAAGWERLKLVLKRERYIAACESLIDKSRALARTLPHPIPLTRTRVAEAGADVDEVVRITNAIERVLPQLMIAVDLFALDFRAPQDLLRSPFPPEVRRTFEQVQGGVS
jgi:halocarboxylic acid dehydrogenase DehI